LAAIRATLLLSKPKWKEVRFRYFVFFFRVLSSGQVQELEHQHSGCVTQLLWALSAEGLALSISRNSSRYTTLGPGWDSVTVHPGARVSGAFENRQAQPALCGGGVFFCFFFFFFFLPFLLRSAQRCI
jgi:hypothetical protein